MSAPTYAPVPTTSRPLPPPPPPLPATPTPFPDIIQSPYTALGLGYIKKFRKEYLSSLRPFSEFLDINRLSKPDGFATVIARLNYNLSYFQSNYMLVFLGITAYSVINNTMLMFSTGFVTAGMYFISKVPQEGIIIGLNRYNPRQLQTGLVCVAVPMFFFSSTIGTIFYIVGASAVSILGHAAFMQEDFEGDFTNVV